MPRALKSDQTEDPGIGSLSENIYPAQAVTGFFGVPGFL